MKNELKELIKEYTAVSAVLSRSDTEEFFSEKGKACAESTVNGWNAVFIAAIPYNNGEEKPPYGIARYAWGEDYHRVARKILEKSVNYIHAHGGECAVFCDTSPVPERELAAAAGLGVIGKNGLLITEKYGSYVVLAGLIIRCDGMETDEKVPITACIGCNACVKACPGGALKDSGFDPKLCISDMTQKRGELTSDEKRLLRHNKAVWGCDICQDVCPMNRNIDLTAIPEFQNNLIKNITPDMTALSNREFEKSLGNRAFSWRGAAVLRRNLELNNIK